MQTQFAAKLKAKCLIPGPEGTFLHKTVNYLHGFRQVRSMFKLGEYCEIDAKAIADHLKDAGIRVELRPSIDAAIESDDVLQGRFSDLKVDIKDENCIAKYEHYLDALKKTLQENPDLDDFSERYLLKLLPTIKEKRKIIQEMFGDICSDSDEYGARIENPVKVNGGKQTAEQPNRISVSGDSADTSIDDGSGDEAPDGKFNHELIEAMTDLAGVLREGSEAREFASSVINLNDIEDGVDIGSRLDDPIVAISIDRDDYERDHPKLKRVLSVFLDKNYDLYVDEFTLLHIDTLDEEFIEKYADENIKLGSMKLLLADMIENHPSERMDLQDFEDDCCLNIDTGKRVLKVIGYTAAAEIAKTLEKNGIIKIKGDVIRWKK
jgi:hypothetical protein